MGGERVCGELPRLLGELRCLELSVVYRKIPPGANDSYRREAGAGHWAAKVTTVTPAKLCKSNVHAFPWPAGSPAGGLQLWRSDRPR